MSTNYTWYILLCMKEDQKVVYTHLVHVYSKFNGSHKIFSDSGIELKKRSFVQVVSTSVMKHLFCYPHYS